MKTRILLSACLISVGTWAQNTFGDIIGTLVDNQKAGVFGATVETTDGSAVYRAITDPDGRFRISAVPPGTYTVVFKLDTMRVVAPLEAEVSPNGFGNVGVVIFQTAEAKEIPGVTVINNIRIKVTDAPVTELGRKDILHNTARQSVTDLVAGMTTDVKKSDDGSLVFRGARKGDMIYYIDGVKLNEVFNVPSAAIGSIIVYSGAIPAKYGDTNGGVIVLETVSYNDLYRAWKRMNGEKL